MLYNEALRYNINNIKIENILLNVSHSSKVVKYTNRYAEKELFLVVYLQDEDDCDDCLMDAVPGFFLVCTSNGKLVYISSNVKDLLGHSIVSYNRHRSYNKHMIT